MMIEKYSDIISELIKFSALGYVRSLTIADSGNVSCRCKDGILISASGVSLREIDENKILLMDLDGKVLYNPSGLKPSKEANLHLSIYRYRESVNCVYHVHPPYATAFAAKGITVPLITTTSQRKLGIVPLVPAATPGSELLAKHVTETITNISYESVKALILENHGIITFGATAEESFNLAELLEITARISIYLKQIG